MNINHISVSRTKCFDLCQQQYKYKYHLKLPSPGPEPFYFTYGKIVHRIAEVYVNAKGKTPIGEVAQEVVRGKIPLDDEGKICPPIPQDHQKKLQKHMRAIQNLTDKIGSGGLVEYEFNYDLEPPHKRHVTGFIDRLIIKEKKAFIIDYKTTKKGKWRVNKETVVEDLQLRMYARVVQKDFGFAAENIKCALYYLDGENLIAAQYSNQDLLQTEKDLLDAYKRIEQADPDKVWGNVGWHCKNCDYSQICTFYKPQNRSGSAWDGDLDSLGHDSNWGGNE